MADTTTKGNDMERLAEIGARYLACSQDDRDTIALVMSDVIDTITSASGGGIMFLDPKGTGTMNVHLLGDVDLAPSMLIAAPAIYESLFGVPDGVELQ